MNNLKILTPDEATQLIRNKSRDYFNLTPHMTKQAKAAILEHDIIMGDIFHLLWTGQVFEEGKATTREGWFKYKIEGTTPNSGAGGIAAIVIPDITFCDIKIQNVFKLNKQQTGEKND